MTLSFEDAQQLWATERFKNRAEYDKGLDYRDGDTFSVDSTIVYGGYCETCSYETAGFSITNNRNKKYIKVESSYAEMVLSISRFAEED